MRGVVIYNDTYEHHPSPKLKRWKPEHTQQFKEAQIESANLFSQAFSGIGCTEITVHERPSFQQLHDLFTVELAAFARSEPEKQKVVVLGYAGHGQIGPSYHTEANLDAAENNLFPIEAMLQYIGCLGNAYVLGVFNCGRMGYYEKKPRVEIPENEGVLRGNFIYACEAGDAPLATPDMANEFLQHMRKVQQLVQGEIDIPGCFTAMEHYWSVLNGRGSSRTAGYPIRVTYD